MAGKGNMQISGTKSMYWHRVKLSNSLTKLKYSTFQQAWKLNQISQKQIQFSKKNYIIIL
jgi:hypothetical protein